MLAKLRIATNAGAGPTSDRPRSVTVHLSGKRGTLVGVVNAIRASKIDIERIGARYVTVEVPRGDALIDVAARVARALDKAGVVGTNTKEQ